MHIVHLPHTGCLCVQVSGLLKYVCSGDGVVMGVNKNDEIFRRAGVTASNPAGTSWTKLNGGLKLVDCYNPDYFWGVNFQDSIYHS